MFSKSMIVANKSHNVVASKGESVQLEQQKKTYEDAVNRANECRLAEPPRQESPLHWALERTMRRRLDDKCLERLSRRWHLKRSPDFLADFFDFSLWAFSTSLPDDASSESKDQAIEGKDPMLASSASVWLKMLFMSKSTLRDGTFSTGILASCKGAQR